MEMSAAKSKRRRYAAPIGGLFLLLALIGLACVVIGSIYLTGRVLDNSREKTKLEDIVRPLVMFDTVPFERATDIDKTQMLYICMWSALLDAKGQVYRIDENQEMLVPASDLDVAAARLFGPEVKLEHKTFGEYENTYFYDAEKQTYSVPISIQLYVYSPRVESIEKSGENYLVRVGYVPPTGAYTVNLQGDRENPEPEKYMIYVMKKTGDSYQVVAVRDDVSGEGQTHAVLPNAS